MMSVKGLFVSLNFGEMVQDNGKKGIDLWNESKVRI